MHRDRDLGRDIFAVVQRRTGTTGGTDLATPRTLFDSFAAATVGFLFTFDRPKTRSVHRSTIRQPVCGARARNRAATDNVERRPSRNRTRTGRARGSGYAVSYQDRLSFTFGGAVNPVDETFSHFRRPVENPVFVNACPRRKLGPEQRARTIFRKKKIPFSRIRIRYAY